MTAKRKKLFRKSRVTRRTARWLPGAVALLVIVASAYGWVYWHRPRPITISPPQHVTSAHAEAGGPQFGVADGNALAYLSDARLAAALKDMRSLGAAWVRYDINWSYVQFQRSNNYDWADYDRLVSAVNHAGLKSLVTIAYTPLWARNAACASAGDSCPPANPAAFATFAAAAVARYAPQGVHAWEIWNEPNSATFWKPAPDPVAYADLLKAAAPAIRAHDASATIVLGGLTGSITKTGSLSATDFLQAVYGSGAKNDFTAVGMHPYTYPFIPGAQGVFSWEEMGDAPINLRDIMVGQGDTGKKIWITEFGAPTNGPGTMLTENSHPSTTDTTDFVSESLQAQLATDAVTQYTSLPWAGPFFWYGYQDLGSSISNRENFFGLLRADGSKKPAYFSYKQAVAKALAGQ